MSQRSAGAYEEINRLIIAGFSPFHFFSTQEFNPPLPLNNGKMFSNDLSWLTCYLDFM